MIKKILKQYIMIIIIPILLLILTLTNTLLISIKNNNIKQYDNIISTMLNENKVSEINYDLLQSDLNKISEVLSLMINKNETSSIKSMTYKTSADIFDNKILEIMRVLSDRIDDEDYGILQKNIEEFNDSLVDALYEIDKVNKSEVEALLHKNRYLYEEKKNKAFEILENYKGFLQ